MIEVAGIVKSLTKAQREALVKLPLSFALDTAMDGTVMLDSWVTSKDAGVRSATLSSMNGLGGVDPVTLECGPILVTYDWGERGQRFWKLTDLGVAVRSALTKENDRGE